MIRIALIEASEIARCALCSGAQECKDGRVLEMQREGFSIYFCGACFAEILNKVNASLLIEGMARQAQTMQPAAGVH